MKFKLPKLVPLYAKTFDKPSDYEMSKKVFDNEHEDLPGKTNLEKIAIRHMKNDELLCCLLEQLGYTETARQFRNTNRLYGKVVD